MKCNLKTMLSLAAAVLAALAVAYFAVPAAQVLIVASAPILLSLICPVMMIGMMWSMRGKSSGATQATPKAKLSLAKPTSDRAQEA
jgi:MFS superfamily sulfate permease-like transporter